jgi:predicted RecA/RadA family phage recombinase
LDRTYTRAWTATEGGTAISINAYITAWNPLEGYYRLYNQVGGSGDVILVGSVDVLALITAPAWNKINLTAFGAQSLTFSAGDVLLFGVAWGEEGSTASGLGRNDAAGSLWFSTSNVTSTGPDPIVLTETTDRDMALILEYDPA